MATDLKAFGALLGKAKVSERKPASSRTSNGPDPSENPMYAHMVKSMEKTDQNGDGQSVELPLPNTEENIKTAKRLTANAARAREVGYRTRVTDVTDESVTFILWSAAPAEDYGDATCPTCNQDVRVTADSKLRVHGPQGARCEGSGLTVEQPEPAGA